MYNASRSHRNLRNRKYTNSYQRLGYKRYENTKFKMTGADVHYFPPLSALPLFIS